MNINSLKPKPVIGSLWVMSITLLLFSACGGGSADSEGIIEPPIEKRKPETLFVVGKDDKDYNGLMEVYKLKDNGKDQERFISDDNNSSLRNFKFSDDKRSLAFAYRPIGPGVQETIYVSSVVQPNLNRLQQPFLNHFIWAPNSSVLIYDKQDLTEIRTRNKVYSKNLISGQETRISGSPGNRAGETIHVTKPFRAGNSATIIQYVADGFDLPFAINAHYMTGSPATNSHRLFKAPKIGEVAYSDDGKYLSAAYISDSGTHALKSIEINEEARTSVNRYIAGNIDFDNVMQKFRPHSHELYFTKQENQHIYRYDNPSRELALLVTAERTCTLTTCKGGIVNMVFSPNGKYLAVLGSLNQANESELFVIDLTDAENPIQTKIGYGSTGRVGEQFKWSNDSQTLAFAVHGVRGGQDSFSIYDLYSANVPKSSAKKVTTSLSGYETVVDFAWSPNSKGLTYSKGILVPGFNEAVAEELYYADLFREEIEKIELDDLVEISEFFYLPH